MAKKKKVEPIIPKIQYVLEVGRGVRSYEDFTPIGFTGDIETTYIVNPKKNV